LTPEESRFFKAFERKAKGIFLKKKYWSRWIELSLEFDFRGNHIRKRRF